ncbi:MAG: DNRLRE domain-containing protein [bacterium]|jgi:hypothetical protein
MKRTVYLTFLVAVLGLAVIGCQNEPNPVVSRHTAGTMPSNQLSKVSIPEDAVLDSAILYLYVTQSNNQTIRIHRVTSDWDEYTVTWSNFGTYDPTEVSNFVADGLGWRFADITTLVAGWLEGDFSNYGLLIRQDELTYPRAHFNSREAASNHPYIKVCYTLDGTATCVTDETIADVYISELSPNYNFGDWDILHTGWANPTALEKQSLLRFDFEETPCLNCIGNYVWHDVNRNGIQDEGELGIGGVAVHLFDCTGAPIASTLTNAEGYYQFCELPSGDYYLHFVAPMGYVFTMKDQGSDDALDSDADPTTGMTACTNLNCEDDMTWDAGLYIPEELGCSFTIGYWKNHAGLKRQPDMVTALLPIWLGNAGGAKSYQVTTALMAVDFLKQDVYGTPENGITKLYAQLLGAKLNIENGASNMTVSAIITAADNFLATHNYLDWAGMSEFERQMVLGWHDMLDDYNNGLLGPLHCE